MNERDGNRQMKHEVIICRGVRGATVASADTREAIHSATVELVKAMMEANDMQADDLASAFAHASDSEYPIHSNGNRMPGDGPHAATCQH